RINVHPGKDSLYISAITNLEESFSGIPYSSLISFNKAKYYYEEGVKYNSSVSDAHKWEIKKALEICNTAIEKYPDTFGAQECRWLQNSILQKSLKFQTEYGNIPRQPFRSLISYKNVNKVFIRVIPWNESLDKKEKNLSAQELINYYTKQKAVKEWSLDLPDDKDYQQHSVEIKMPELSAGKYLILTATDKKFTYKKNTVGYSKIWVSNLSYFRRDIGNNTVQIYAVHRNSGHQLANVDVEILLQKYFPDDREYRFKRIADGTTDDEGLFEYKKDTDTYGNYKIVLKKGSDRFESQNYYSYYYGNDPVKRMATHFFLDRAIYRPGQVVYFKGLMLETDGKKDHEIITDHKTTVTFYDANSQKISDVTLTTNEYGTFNGQFTIPFGKIGGQYYIMNEVGSQYFRVEEYKRPKFEVKFEPVKGSYSLNDEVTATGFAKTYSGANLNDVEVKYRVVRNVSFPYFYYWWRGYYNWYWGNYTEMEITNGVTRTDKEGKFKVEFDLIPDLSIPGETNPVFNYTVFADVVDVTGETHSAQTYVRAGYVALVASINLPEIVNNKSSDKYSVSTTNLNGQFEPAKVSVDVYMLKTPSRIFRNRLWQKPDEFLLTEEDFYESFVHDVYNEEDQFFNWEKDKKVFQTSFTTSDSSFIAFEDQDDWESGKYVVNLKTKDKNGTPVELIKYFTLFDPESDKTPLREPSWIYLIEKSYAPGETAILYIGSAEEDVKALYELEYDGKIIKKEWITLDDEQVEIEIPIKEDYRGNVVVRVTLTVNNENHTLTKVITVPWTNKHLNITFETFRNKILPGTEEEWKLKITGPNGDAIAAELLASMYDASLDAFAANYWGFNIYQYYYGRLNWTT
ncbi:MAG: MG2 domain-containing protein, partial [Ignavibacteriaceae bacterium]